MKKTWVGTSWKMNKTLAEALAFADELARQPVSPHPDLVRFILPPFTAVRQVKARLAATDVKVGAQNMHWEDARRLDRRDLARHADRLRRRCRRNRPFRAARVLQRNQ